MSTKSAPSQFTVAILPIGDVSSYHTEFIADMLERKFGVKTITLDKIKIPFDCFNAEHQRYESGPLLNTIFSYLPLQAQRIMGVIAGNLRNDNKPCFGIGSFYYKKAVCSVMPASKWKYLSDEDRISQLVRYYIVAAHEFGHTLGLKHCQDDTCLMYEMGYSGKRSYNKDMCEACQKWADRELKVNPYSAEECFSRAEAMYKHNKLPEAIDLYRKAIGIAPCEPLYYHYLGEALNKAGHFEEAKQKTSRAAGHSNDTPKFYYTFALMSLRDDLEEAEDYFTKALAVTENPQKLHKLIGQAYREIRHDVERASRHYKEYLRLGGDDPDVVEWLISRGQMEQS